MSRTFWFVAGAAASAFVVVKGRQYYRRLTPAGVAERIEKRVEQTSEDTKAWLTDFADLYNRERAAKKSELLAMLASNERGRLT